MIRSIEFYLGISREMKALKCSEMYIGVDDMEELITRLLQAEKDAARYRWVRSASIAELNEFCNMIRPHRDGFVDDAIIEDDMQCSK